MSYSERVPHPLDDGEPWPLWKWLLAIGLIAGLLYLAWRAGWFSKATGEAAKIASGPANPFGWR